jgi:hypothetical protein
MLNSANKFVCCVCSIWIVMATMAVSTSQAAVARIAISTARIVDAMASAGIAVSPDRIEVLSGANSATEHATMRVVSVSHGNAGTLQVKLRCQDNHECLPFYVVVHGVDGKAGGAKVRAVPGATASPLQDQDIVRGGDHATLILESPDSRMSFPVVCLQSGARGQKVRVSSPDRKRFYDAEVVAAGIVKGRL